jgi:hypothetical protein
VSEEMPEQLTPSQQAAYAQYYGDLDAQRNAISQRDTNAFNAQFEGKGTPYLQPKPAWGMYAGSGQGMGREYEIKYGGYDPGSGSQKGTPDNPFAGMYKKLMCKNLNKTTKQIRAAIYTTKKPKDLTKSQKIVIEEMFGKQIVTKPIKNQKPRR